MRRSLSLLVVSVSRAIEEPPFREIKACEIWTFSVIWKYKFFEEKFASNSHELRICESFTEAASRDKFANSPNSQSFMHGVAESFTEAAWQLGKFAPLFFVFTEFAPFLRTTWSYLPRWSGDTNWSNSLNSLNLHPFFAPRGILYWSGLAIFVFFIVRIWRICEFVSGIGSGS
jgi:hypothetical protein